jgi:hypothetical protein
MLPITGCKLASRALAVFPGGAWGRTRVKYGQPAFYAFFVFLSLLSDAKFALAGERLWLTGRILINNGNMANARRECACSALYFESFRFFKTKGLQRFFKVRTTPSNHPTFLYGTKRAWHNSPLQAFHPENISQLKLFPVVAYFRLSAM